MRSTNPRISSFLFAFCLLFVLTLSSNIFAQTGTSSVKGTITDTQGNVVAGAKVLLRNVAKNFERTQISNNDGQFSFTSVPPETYELSIEATGFKRSVVANVRALVDTTVTQNATLEA